MLITAKEYAARTGLHPRTVRLQLTEGRLAGKKLPDPESGVLTWYVEVPDEEILVEIRAVGNDPAPRWEDVDPSIREEDPAGGREDPSPGQEDPARGIAQALQQALELVEKLHRENLELGGRAAFYQGRLLEAEQRLQVAEARIALLEAPKEEPSPAPKPWWKFW